MAEAAGTRAKLFSLRRFVLTWDDATANVSSYVGWAIDLFLRIWLAQSFLTTAVARMMDGPLIAEPGGGVFHGAAMLLEAVAPFLLALGLFTRPAALTLLILVSGPFLLGAGPLEPIRASVLLWYVLAGPGPAALDSVMRHGMRHVALPFAGTWADLTAGLQVLADTAFLLGLRIWVAVLLIGFFGMAFGDVLHIGLAVLTLTLAAGVLTRATAILLAVLPLALPGMVDAAAGYPTFPLVLLVMTGPGKWSFDRWIADRMRARHLMRINGDVPHVVIIGAGFAGVAAAMKLRHAACRVTILDRRNHHLFQPLLYQVAVGALSPADIAVPVRDIFRDQENARFLLDECVSIDDDARTVHLRSGGRLTYDQLMICTGAKTSYFGNDHWADDAPGLKDVDDATEIRRKILMAFERAEAAETEAERTRLQTFVVVGGGPTGVELAGAIAELAHFGLAGGFHNIRPEESRVILVQAADRLLPPFEPASSARAAEDLRRLGVELLFDCRYGGIEGDDVILGDERLPAASVFWAAGVAASPAAEWLGIETADRGGRIAVEGDMSLPGKPHVFVAGDVASSNAWNGNNVPGLAASAKQMGDYVGKVLRARVEGLKEPGPFVYSHLGSLATIGRDAAVADFGKTRVAGTLAWWLWGAVHILLLTGVRNRLSVAIDWVWAYLTYRQGTLLITGREPVQPVAEHPVATAAE